MYRRANMGRVDISVAPIARAALDLVNFSPPSQTNALINRYWDSARWGLSPSTILTLSVEHYTQFLYSVSTRTQNAFRTTITTSMEHFPDSTYHLYLFLYILLTYVFLFLFVFWNRFRRVSSSRSAQNALCNLRVNNRWFGISFFCDFSQEKCKKWEIGGAYLIHWWFACVSQYHRYDVFLSSHVVRRPFPSILSSVVRFEFSFVTAFVCVLKEQVWWECARLCAPLAAASVCVWERWRRKCVRRKKYSDVKFESEIMRDLLEFFANFFRRFEFDFARTASVGRKDAQKK